MSLILTYSRKNGPEFPLLPEEEVIKVIKCLKKIFFYKLYQHAYVTTGGNKKVFDITTLGLRNNLSLLVFTL